MKCFAVVLLALVAAQSAAADYKKPVYTPAPKPVYHKPVYTPKAMPSPVPSPAPKPVTVTCTPKPVITHVDANITCGEGYTLVPVAAGYKGAQCTKQVCVDPKPVYTPKKPVYTKHYMFGKKYEPETYTKPVYTPKAAPAPVPVPSPVPVCKTEYAHPIYVCATGYTLSGSKCVLSTPGPCPPTYTASAGVCSYTYIPTYDPKKPVYTAPSKHYFFGKLFDKLKKEDKYEDKHEDKYEDKHYKPKGPTYCVYPEPSPSPKPSPVIVKKPVYVAPKKVYEPKKTMSFFNKHGL